MADGAAQSNMKALGLLELKAVNVVCVWCRKCEVDAPVRLHLCRPRSEQLRSFIVGVQEQMGHISNRSRLDNTHCQTGSVSHTLVQVLLISNEQMIKSRSIRRLKAKTALTALVK